MYEELSIRRCIVTHIYNARWDDVLRPGTHQDKWEAYKYQGTENLKVTRGVWKEALWKIGQPHLPDLDDSQNLPSTGLSKIQSPTTAPHPNSPWPKSHSSQATFLKRLSKLLSNALAKVDLPLRLGPLTRPMKGFWRLTSEDEREDMACDQDGGVQCGYTGTGNEPTT